MVRPEKGLDKRIPEACEQVAVQITDAEKLREIVAQSSAVFYCAGTVRGRSPRDFEAANIQGVNALVKALEAAVEPAPMLLLSSLAASQPQLSDYAHSKHKGEQSLSQTARIPWAIFRPSAVYGPGDREMLPLLKMIRRGLLLQTGPSEQRISLLHVDDLVDAMLCWLSAPQKCGHRIYSIDDGKVGGYSWPEIAEAVSDGGYRVLQIPRILLNMIASTNQLASGMFGYSPMLTPGKVRELVHSQWLCNVVEFCSDTDWQPDLKLKQGIEQMFAETENISAS